MGSLKGWWGALRLRNKLLSFYTVTISVIILINLVTSSTAFSSMRVFNANLQSYFNIHQLQLAVQQSRVAAERYLRERSLDARADYRTLAPRIRALLDEIEHEPPAGRESALHLRAAHRGLDAYFGLMDLAIAKRSKGEPDYYSTYVRGARIQGYVDGYLSLLLSLRLSDGSSSYEALLNRQTSLRAVALLALLLLGLLSIAFGVLFANSVSRPVRRLAVLSARIAAGDLEVAPLPVDSSDEIGVLSESFNAMSHSIRQRVRDLREKAALEQRLHAEELTIVRMERSLREAQFLGLQAQINPHFLFNTLNTIARTALFEHADSTAALIHSLARLFRYNLRDSRKTVTLQEELEILDEYLSIQRRRYEARLQVSMRCAVDAGRIVVPCFTLQPLVENALKHGIEPKEEGGRIEVRVERCGEEVRISVSDDGLGMSPGQLRRLRHGGQQSAGIGIPNVVNRLRLLYEGREGFSIRSRPGGGTAVTITIPVACEVPDYVPTPDR